MDDQIRASDTDRDRVTARLRDHFAEGRLSRGELDERISAALGATTIGDLRRLMADLPGPVPVRPAAAQRPPWAGPTWMVRRRGPRILPLMLLVLLAALLLPGGGWLLLAFFKLVLVFWLVSFLAAVLFASRLRRRLRRGQLPGHTQHEWGHAPW
jgi:hypothetical protein